MGSPNLVHVFQFPINGGATTLTAFPSSKCQGDRGHTAVCPLSAARAVPLCRLSIVPHAATRDNACNSACGAREKRSDPVHRMSASAWSRCIVNVWPCAGLIVRSTYLYSRACVRALHGAVPLQCHVGGLGCARAHTHIYEIMLPVMACTESFGG